jgi:hypothetical protein
MIGGGCNVDGVAAASSDNRVRVLSPAINDT